MTDPIGPDETTSSSDATMLVEGERFGGSNGRRFLVEKRVGAGGQALVFRVRDTRLDRLAAAKVSTAHENRQKQLFLERFERELRLSSRVNHPHVLQVYDCGELKSGTPFVILEWMDRGDLVGLIERAKAGGRALPLGYVQYYALALAAALRAVHNAQMIHRDVKPDNVLIAHDGVAKLTDFGIAKDISPDAIGLTEVGQTMGTLGFMAPEQLQGLPGPQSDIFSFGVTVYALICGRTPPQKTLNSIPVGRVLDTAWDPVPVSWQPVLKWCLATALEDRAEHFDEVLDRIRALKFGPDERGQLLPGELPPLPSGAFFTSSPSVEAPAPIFDSDTMDDGPGPDTLGDTMDLTVVDTNKDEPAAAAAGGHGVGINTGGQTSLGPVSPAAAMSDVDRLSSGEVIGATRPFPAASSEDIAGSGPLNITSGGADQRAASVPRDETVHLATRKKSPLLLVVLALLVVGGAVAGVVLSSGGGLATDEAVVAAGLAYDAAAAKADWEGAVSAVSGLAPEASALATGSVLLAQDALLAGDLAQAKALAQPHVGAPGGLGARANLVVAAAHRLGSSDGYGSAADAYALAASCQGADCYDLGQRGSRGLAEACLVAGYSPGSCGSVTRVAPGDCSLASSLVLLEDGHVDAGRLGLKTALDEGSATGSCLENAVLVRWAADSGLSGALAAQLREHGARSARDADQCRLFGSGGSR